MTADRMTGGLKLRAEDDEDLAVLSACLQDAFVPVRDIAYAPEQRLFTLLVSRFRWEAASRSSIGPAYQRVLCAIAFGEVRSVSYRGFRRYDDGRILSLLAIRPEGGSDGDTGAVRLEFSGGATIRITVGRIECRVRDLGEPWPTAHYPRHEEEPVE